MSTKLMLTMKCEITQSNIYDLYTNTLSPLTKTNYVSTIKDFFGVNDLSKITIDDIQMVNVDVVNLWARTRLLNGNSKSTINRKLSAMSNFYDFLCRRGIQIMTYNPFSTKQGAIRFKNTTKDYSDKRTLSPSEVSKLLRSVDLEPTNPKNKIVAYRDLLVLQILITAGLRRAELCNIKLGDIMINQGEYVINVVGKGDKARLMVLAQPVKHTMDVYLKLRGVSYKDKELPLIISHSSNADPTHHVDTTTIYRIVKKYADKANLDASTISPHNFRHTFATMSYADLGVNKDTLQAIMGHSSSSTTSRYLKAVDMVKVSPANKIAGLCDIK